ncbi:hypothetical protein C1645_876359 [Glomus cerebriforme]|uniref:WD40-repeat-containing domain protein n=1 Tax=Glomus cerebriforme TaxID=658196 RepID=A0A397T1S9_9GLOM|nr:hypothetical protein C1645_876359 [Glomus cerebriforme]
MSQSSDISVKIDDEINIENNIATDVEKNIATDIEKIDKPHNGKPITMIELSPKGTYLVTYSPEDKSIIGWNVTNVEDEFQLKPDDYCHIIHEYYEYKNMINMCVSDDKKLAYIYRIIMRRLKIIDMNNNGQEIKLNFDSFNYYIYFCTFNLKNEFILHNYKLISISKYDKLYLLFSGIYIHEWDLLTEKSIRMFVNEEKIEISKFPAMKSLFI